MIDENKDSILFFFQENFPQPEITFKTLLNLDLIDSIFFTEFSLFLEKKFNIILNPRDAKQENFKNIESIAAMVQKKINEKL